MWCSQCPRRQPYRVVQCLSDQPGELRLTLRAALATRLRHLAGRWLHGQGYGHPGPTGGKRSSSKEGRAQPRDPSSHHWGAAAGPAGLWTEPSYTVMRPFLVSTSRDSPQHTPDALPQNGQGAGVTPYSAIGGGAPERLGEAAHLAPSGLPLRHTYLRSCCPWGNVCSQITH